MRVGASFDNQTQGTQKQNLRRFQEETGFTLPSRPGCRGLSLQLADVCEGKILHGVSDTESAYNVVSKIDPVLGRAD